MPRAAHLAVALLALAIGGCKNKDAASNSAQAQPTSSAAVAPGQPARLGSVQVLMHDVKGGSALAATDAAVFVASDGGIVRLPAAGGDPTTVEPSKQGVAFFTVSGGDAIVADRVDSGDEPVRRFPLANPSQGTQLCAGAIGSYFDVPRAVVDDDNIYWRKGDGATSTFFKCARRSGGTAVKVAEGVKVDGPALVLAGHQLVCGDSAGNLTTLSTDGGSPKTILTSAITGNEITSLAWDGEYVYLARAGGPMGGGARYKNGSIERVKLTGGDPQPLANDQEWPEHLIVDDVAVYWATRDHAIKRVKKAGGTVETLDTATQAVSMLAVNKQNIYWLLGGTSESAHQDGQVVGRGK